MTTTNSDPFAGEDGVEFEFTAEDVEPQGVAEVQCVGMASSYSKAGNPMVEWTFRLLKYIDAKIDDADFIGKEWTVYTALTEKAQWKVHETLVALGIRTDDDAETKVKFKRDDVLGVVCLAEITHDTYRGQQQSVINALAPHNKKPGKKQKIKKPAADKETTTSAEDAFGSQSSRSDKGDIPF